MAISDVKFTTDNYQEILEALDQVLPAWEFKDMDEEKFHFTIAKILEISYKIGFINGNSK